VAFTLVVRGGVLALAPGSLASDPDGYRYLAENLLERGTYGYGQVPTAYRPPLYPLALAPCLLFGPATGAAIAALHLAMGLATVWLVYRLAARWGLGRWSPLAAGLVACDPILLVQSTQVMTETPAALLAVLSLLALTSSAERPTVLRGVLAGASVGLATLCRATFLAWALVVALVLPAFARRRTERLRLLASFAAAVAVVLAPWAVRNYVQFGRPILATTHGGYTLLLGNNPSFYRYLRSGAWGRVWDADAFNRAWRARATRSEPADELRNDRLAYAEALRTIRSQPALFVYSCAVRAGRLWAPLPHQVDPRETAAKRWARYLVGVWYLAELALSLIGIVAILRRDDLAVCEAGGPRQSWQSTWLWGILLAACFTGVHALYWSNLRMRAPLMPVVAMAAAAGAARIVSGASARKSISNSKLRS
jgi:4-amino-4-deoxy-L-arabinose transferase-like glycosyltransferase